MGEREVRPSELLALILSALLGVGLLGAIVYRQAPPEKVPVPVPLQPDQKKPDEKRRPLLPRPRTNPLGD